MLTDIENDRYSDKELDSTLWTFVYWITIDNSLAFNVPTLNYWIK